VARVLVVDDEKSLRLTLSAFLTDAGHEVIVAEDSESAYAIFSGGEIDVVLTDIIMQQSSGVELLKRIRKFAARVPVILMTGEPSLETAAAAVREHAFDYLTKPISKDDIVAVVASATLEKDREDAVGYLHERNMRDRKKLEETVEDQSAELITSEELLFDQMEATSESEDRYEKLLDIVGDAVLLIDAETKRIINVNAAALAMYGYSIDEFVGLNHSAITDEPEKSRDSFEKAIAEEGAVTIPVRYHRRADGEIFPVEITGTNVNLSGKQMFCGVIRDISERKRIEEEIHEQQKLIDTVLNAQVDTFFLFEPVTGKAIRWNRAFSRISGYTDEEIASMKAPDSYYSAEDEDLQKAYAFIHQVKEEGEGTIELSLIRKDGRRVPTEYVVSVVNDNASKPKYFISIGRDISTRRNP
jgi:PAS domain S-box-containing protein